MHGIELLKIKFREPVPHSRCIEEVQSLRH
jgi:hypothetical protein